MQPGGRFQFVEALGTSPSRRRVDLWFWLAAGLVLVLIGGGTGFVLARSDPDPRAEPPLSPAIVTPSATRPGLEPPRAGDWPARWPAFGPDDRTRRVELDGLGFALTLPATWICTPASNGDEAVTYRCGATLGGEGMGGEVTVRRCPDPCDTARRDALRKAEQAWAMQWRYAGPDVTIAETMAVDGARRYGLVLIAYWCSSPGGPVDRQLLLRMIAPVNWLDDIRRVANGVRAEHVL